MSKPKTPPAITTLTLALVLWATAPALYSQCSAPAGDLGGTVFVDRNSNGAFDPGEQVAPGISVSAFGADNTLLASTTSAIDGSYSFTGLFATYSAARLEFSGLERATRSAPVGTDSASSVQHHRVASCQADFGVHDPADYCQQDPDVAVTCFVGGDPLIPGGIPEPIDTIVSFPYSRRGLAGPPAAPQYSGFPQNPPTKHASASETGSVWGSAYNRDTGKVFVTAFLKRHAGLGPLGIGGIYVGDWSSGSPTSFTNFVDAVSDLSVDLGAVPTNAARGLPSTNQTASPGSLFSWDPDVFVMVGMRGFGDLDLSDDGNTLYAVNLFEGNVVEIDISAYNDDGTTLPTAANVRTLTPPTASCTSGAQRPFGLAFEREVLYLGVVCSAEAAGTRSDLDARVYSFDTVSEVWSTALGPFSLDYVKGPTFSLPASSGLLPTGECLAWYPWSSDWSDVKNPVTGGSFRCLPQPVLSDIEFDLDGSMVLALMDRFGHQGGYLQYRPDPAQVDTGAHYAITGGDLLRAERIGTGWVLESGGTTPGGGGGGANGQGIGGGEYYGGDYWSNLESPTLYREHEETALGSLALKVGSGEVLATVMDPVDKISMGLRWFDNQTGASNENDAYELVARTRNQVAFGKAAGLGDIAVLCDPTPLEIGNYIWIDLDRDGIQDPAEIPIAGIVIELLLDPDGIPGNGDEISQGFDTTDVNGHYAFAVAPASNYLLTVDPAQPNLVNYLLSTSNYGGSGGDTNDSDAVAAAGEWRIPVATGSAGDNDHTFDIGVAPVTADISLTKSVNFSTVAVGQILSYTVTVHNDGPETATGVVIQDLLPTGLSYAGNIAGGDARSDAAAPLLEWTINSLALGASVSLTYDAQVLQPTGAADEYRNVAQVTSMNEADTDSMPNNDDGDQSEDDEDAAIVSPRGLYTVPTLGHVGIGLLFLLLAGGGLMVLRRSS